MAPLLGIAWLLCLAYRSLEVAALGAGACLGLWAVQDMAILVALLSHSGPAAKECMVKGVPRGKGCMPLLGAASNFL